MPMVVYHLRGYLSNTPEPLSRFSRKVYKFDARKTGCRRYAAMIQFLP